MKSNREIQARTFIFDVHSLYGRFTNFDIKSLTLAIIEYRDICTVSMEENGAKGKVGFCLAKLFWVRYRGFSRHKSGPKRDWKGRHDQHQNRKRAV